MRSMFVMVAAVAAGGLAMAASAGPSYSFVADGSTDTPDVPNLVVDSGAASGSVNRSVRDDRQHFQSFALTEEVEIDKVYLVYAQNSLGTGDSFTFNFYSLAGDVETAPVVKALEQTGTFNVPGANFGGSGYLIFDLDNTVLSAGAYAFEITVPSGSTPFFLSGNSATNVTGFRSETGGTTKANADNRDYAFAVQIVSDDVQIVPQPASVAMGLLGLGGLSIFGRRRRMA